MKEYIDHGTIEENGAEKTAEEMVSALVSDYRQIRDEIQHTIELAEDKSDHSTADLYIALTQQQNPVLENSMNTNLSNWFILYTKLHRFHWYVKGPQFFTLHEKFEELYNHASETADVIAERLLAIGWASVSRSFSTKSCHGGFGNVRS
ncbi:hypothetical protein DT075_11800 [Bacillus licheniformis]|nr:hypothetical protein DT075_11800 [Bacillus licheniformis]